MDRSFVARTIHKRHKVSGRSFKRSAFFLGSNRGVATFYIRYRIYKIMNGSNIRHLILTLSIYLTSASNQHQYIITLQPVLTRAFKTVTVLQLYKQIEERSIGQQQR